MSLLIGAWTIGLILSLLALGVFISFRIFSFPDITADGSSTLGAAVAAAMIVKGVNPVVATAAGFVAGFAAGAVTGTLATKFKINGLLSGILVMTGLYSVNLHIMGRSNVPLLGEKTLATYAQGIGTWVLGGRSSLNVMGWEASSLDASVLVLTFFAIALTGVVLYAFFQTHLGTAMRATGDNSQMIRALGVNDGGAAIAGGTTTMLTLTCNGLTGKVARRHCDQVHMDGLPTTRQSPHEDCFRVIAYTSGAGDAHYASAGSRLPYEAPATIVFWIG